MCSSFPVTEAGLPTLTLSVEVGLGCGPLGVDFNKLIEGRCPWHDEPLILCTHRYSHVHLMFSAGIKPPDGRFARCPSCGQCYKREGQYVWLMLESCCLFGVRG